jgi:CheY-like chemotaxis protein/anti-sigma regulatory factor (Ser/Thr protein kinase)
MELHLEPVVISELIADCAAMMHVVADVKGIKLETTCDPTGTVVTIDKARVKQIVYNLVSNALKFTPRDGRVTITCAVRPQEVVVAVRDTGVGIKPEDQELIFEEFRQTTNGTQQAEGTGLGLALVRKLVALHGGRVHVESTPGQGSCFTFSIPRGAPAALHDQAVGPSSHGTSGQGDQQDTSRLPVLVVEDQHEAAELLMHYLRGGGYEPYRAASGDEALTIARTLHPFAITLDVLLPGRDGWDILSMLKADPATRDIPVVIVSILDNRELGLAMGATDYLIKPIDKDALLASLKHLRDAAGATSRKSAALLVDG